MTDQRERLNILLIDDDPFTLKLLARQLTTLGCASVVAFHEATDALTHLADATAPVDVVFCDLDMPQMDGVEFVRHLADAGARFGGSLVLVSGEDRRILDAAEKLARAHKLRVAGTLAKPASTAGLLAVLERHIAAGPSVQRGPRRTYGADELAEAMKRGHLQCDYQPLVEVATGKVVGVESLVRWHHAKDGVVYPDQFIGVAEERGLIDELTDVVLTRAVRQCRAWRDHGLDLKVSINVSMDNLGTLSFPDLVSMKLAESGVDASSVVLEVTESRLMKNRLSSLEILTRIRLKHIGLSVDDFGTGHSSLAQLRDLPFGELKIDRSFVHGAWREPSLRAIFSASLGMASQLGMRSVGEGVEDADDWHFLRATGCDLAQGYFIARPMRPEALPDWLKSWQERCPNLLGEIPVRSQAAAKA